MRKFVALRPGSRIRSLAHFNAGSASVGVAAAIKLKTQREKGKVHLDEKMKEKLRALGYLH